MRLGASPRATGLTAMTHLDRYIMAAALRVYVLATLGLTALLTLLTFVEELSFVGQGGYRLIDAMLYVFLGSPSTVVQVAPVSMLLASLLGLGSLASESELTAMRALGVSERGIAWSLLKLALPIFLVLFATAEFVIPPAQQFAQTERAARLSTAASFTGANGFWAQSGGQYLNVERFGYANSPHDIEIFQFTDQGALNSYIHAASAMIQPDGNWLLSNVVRKRVKADQFQTDTLPSLEWKSFLPRQQAQLLVLPPESMPPVELYRYMRDLKRRHQPAARYAEEFWAKASLPLSMAAMILIAIPFVFGSARSQNAGQQLTIGAIIGIAFTLVQQIGAHLDVLLDFNPAIAAMTPPLLTIAAALYLFRRAHR
jgi:lipopolysaccharide export system permease protein